MNKRGTQALTIGFLVLATVVLCSFTLYRFHVGAKSISDSLQEVGTIRAFSFSEEAFKENFLSSNEEKIVGVYSKFANSAGYNNGLKTRGNEFSGYFVFEEIFPEARISSKMEEEFKKIFGNKQEAFFYSSEEMKFVMKREIVNMGTKELFVQGSFPITAIFNFKNRGLHGFEEIWNAKEKCGVKASKKDIEICFEKELPNFKTTISDVESKGERISFFRVEFESRRKFFLDGKLRPAEFGFLVEV
jgi:hypothetical protein